MAEKPTVVDEPAPKTGVVLALAAVMEEVRGVGKDGFHDAPGAKFKFRGVDAVVNAVGPALRKHHVVVSPQLVSVDRRDVQTSGGKASRETCVVVRYVWTGPDGSTLETVVPGEAMDSGDKGTAKAMSVAFRIALLQALCLPTDDADPDSHQYERETPVRPQQATQGQRNGMPTVSAADHARDVLRAHCGKQGYDMARVAARFEAMYEGRKLRTDDDANRITAFTKLLDGMPEAELLPIVTTNGAAQ